jgi:hypothetical protein
MHFEFSQITPATNLDQVYDNFDPILSVDPDSKFYIPRNDQELHKLSFELKRNKTDLHAFLCGHRGSGKTTELQKLCLDKDICEKYLPIFLTAQNFGAEAVNLTHDALLIQIGLKLVEIGEEHKLKASYGDELEAWGRDVVDTFLKKDTAKTEAGAKGNVWLLYFKAHLSTQRDWTREEKQTLEPKIEDLLDILNSMAQELKNSTGKNLLVIVDDLEKGESDAHKSMHDRLFQENYDTLVRPRFSIIYTIPIYFRALAGSRIPNDQTYAFSAIHIYKRKDKQAVSPPLDPTDHGYKTMRTFIESRIENPEALFAEGTLDELIRIGGGLFRETARAIQGAAYQALRRNSATVEMEDVTEVFNDIKKDFQPLIRGAAIETLKAVYDSEQGWIEGIESFLQARAVVEYENGDLWLDLRHVLKPYILELTTDDE